MTQRWKLMRRDAVSRPTLMPRNVASSTMLVKKVRKTTVLPNQRMHASSKNRMRKLMRNRSRYGRFDLGVAAAGYSISGNGQDALAVGMTRGFAMTWRKIGQRLTH